MAVEAGEHYVEHDEVHRFVGGEPHPLLTVVGAQSLVPAGGESSLQKADYRPVVLDDQDPHGGESIIRSHGEV